MSRSGGAAAGGDTGGAGVASLPQPIVVWYPQVGEAPTPDEADSVRQAATVAAALQESGAETGLLIFRERDLASTLGDLLAARPGVVFNLVEAGEERQEVNYLPPLMLRSLDIPFTGSGTDAMLLTTDKVVAKAMMVAHGIPTPDWIGQAHDASADDGRRYLIKPLRGDGSVGIHERRLLLLEGAEAARDGLRDVEADHPRSWFAERYVEGREFNLSVLEVDGEPRVLPAAEIRFDAFPPDMPRVVGYRAKWVPDSFEYRNAVRTFDFGPEDEGLLKELRGLAAACWDLFGLDGYGRVDFRVDADGRPWVLEVNCNPAMAPGTGFVAAAEQAGLGYPELCAAIVEAAAQEKAPAASPRKNPSAFLPRSRTR